MKFDENAKKLTMLCWFSYMINYLARYGFSTSLSDMVADGIFTLEFGGAIGTAFFASYGAGQLVNGLIGAKIYDIHRAFRFCINEYICWTVFLSYLNNHIMVF
ncbi:MAG TPA: hypothetical protein PLS36_09910 [Clostridia bacterium]|nr:hypothetical protein [Clostridia bacterium]